MVKRVGVVRGGLPRSEFIFCRRSLARPPLRCRHSCSHWVTKTASPRVPLNAYRACNRICAYRITPTVVQNHPQQSFTARRKQEITQRTQHNSKQYTTKANNTQQILFQSVAKAPVTLLSALIICCYTDNSSPQHSHTRHTHTRTRAHVDSNSHVYR